MWTLLLLSARAGPVTTVLDDGRIRAEVVVSASPEEVKALLADPAQLEVVSGNGADITLEERDGPCFRYRSEQDTTFSHVVFVARHCQVAGGFQITLEQSDQLSRYDVVWAVSSVPEGTRIQQEIDLATSLPIPQWIVRGTTRRTVLKTFENLQSHFSR